jgi:hypothetical protein
LASSFSSIAFRREALGFPRPRLPPAAVPALLARARLAAKIEEEL